MNIRLQRAVDRYVGVPLCALLSLAHRLRRQPPASEPPRRILIILLSELGSLVHAYPMVARLKERYPDARVHVLQFARNREVLDLLGQVPADNVFTVDDRSLGRFLGDSLSAIRRLRALDLDVVIDCELFARVSAVFAALSGAATRVGFHSHTQEGLYRGSFINRPVLYNPYRHLSQQFLTLASAVESGSRPPAKLPSESLPTAPPPCAFPEEELARATAQLHADFPALVDRRLVLVYPGGGPLPVRAWPLDHYRELCGRLLDDGFAVGVIGLGEDRPLGQAIVGHCGRPECVDLTGYTKTIRHLLMLFHRAALLVANDGGPGQLAALTPMPSLILFGPETPKLYAPLAEHAHSLYLSFACSPCLTAYNHRNSPCDGDNQCLKQVLPADVLAKTRELL